MIPTTWTPIAFRLHDDAKWQEMVGTIVSIADAHRMRERGTLIMAQRRDDDVTALLVKAPKPPQRFVRRLA